MHLIKDIYLYIKCLNIYKHFFEEKDNGVLMTDLIHYALPLGFLGRIMNALIVKNKLKSIFNYRTIKVDELFNTK